MFFYDTRRCGIAALALSLLLAGCAPTVTRSGPSYASVPAAERGQPDFGFRRSVDDLDFSALSFTAWDGVQMAAALPRRPSAPYTIMIYMNGSDLEREHGAATGDLAEILSALPDDPAIHVVLFTGGTNRWQNNVVPAPACTLWQVKGGALVALGSPGMLNMGDAGTLAGFLEFGMTAFPAERYGLILWDHGGGSIAGYGHDENFQDSCLTLLEMNYAFARSPVAQERLEFLGFDACLMATVEMAVVAGDYARYLIASEDLEPGDGWDYGFLSDLAANPTMDGAALGRIIVDRYAEFYRHDRSGSITLSVTDLSRAGQVMGAMGALMAVCSAGLDSGGAITPLTASRRDTRAFGGGTPRDNACDMVDAGDMADRLAPLHPAEAAGLRTALQHAVVYQRHNSDLPLAGLTCYYVYAGAREADATLAVYQGLNMSAQYTDYLRRFADTVAAAPSAPQPVAPIANDAVTFGAGRHLPAINGQTVALYQSGGTHNGQEYATPILLDGRPADLIVWIGEDCPGGQIIGARMEEGYVIQKGIHPIHPDNIVTLCHPLESTVPVTTRFPGPESFALQWTLCP